MPFALKTFASAFAFAALLGTPAVLIAPQNAQAQVEISVNIAPPALPVYVQPPLPAPGYIWVPGYWAWDADYSDYYWAPGYWTEPPEVGVYWTPGYWGWSGGNYIFHTGYWGPTVGFYGGVNYGFGYNGGGYYGGEWNHGVFAYNSAVNNFGSVHVTNVYNRTVINNTTINRVSYNGGPQGIQARPTAAEQAAANQRHIPPTAAQVEHVHAAAAAPGARFSANHGAPEVAAVPKPGEFKGPGVVRATEPGADHKGPDAQDKSANKPGEKAGEPHKTPEEKANADHRPQPEKAAEPHKGPEVKRVEPNKPQQEKRAEPHQAPEAKRPEPHRAPEQKRAEPHRQAARPHAEPHRQPQNRPAPHPHAAAPHPHAPAPHPHAAPPHRGGGEKPKHG